MYADLVRYQRLMTVVTKRWGHQLAALAEQAKIDVALQGRGVIDLSMLEARLMTTFNEHEQAIALDHKVARIVQAARETLGQAGLQPDQVNAVYFTGGSTGLRFLTERIAGLFPQATQVTGDRFASVVSGLGIYAVRRFGH
jgi:hypothetical chaperone protein